MIDIEEEEDTTLSIELRCAQLITNYANLSPHHKRIQMRDRPNPRPP